MDRRCRGRNAAGDPCDARPLRDQTFCFWHSSDHAAEAAEARRLGGLRRRREGTVAGAYDFDGVDTIARLQRLLEIAAHDALALDNSPARIRTLARIAEVGVKLVQAGDHEQRLGALERAVLPQRRGRR